MADLPELFIERMERLLSGEWDAFQREAERVRQYGLRVNTLKIEAEEFERIAPFHLSKIPWIPNGYYYEKEDEPARHPFYAAGLYYLQEPSAMTPASRLIVEPGDKVLDLCAAPGGKATELAARLGGEGLIVANDINKARVRALLRNMELFGVSNSLVVNEPPHNLAERFPEYFDKIMVDAPCSGEGMFRKNPAVMESWREKGPDYFSALQREIIIYAADMLKPGGRMLYSTCTFAPEENEGSITWLLKQRPEMEVIPMEDYEGFSPGILSYDGQTFHEDCSLCRRIWPHHMAGEGHFMALLQKNGESRDEKKHLTGRLNSNKSLHTNFRNNRKQGTKVREKNQKNTVRRTEQTLKKVLEEFFEHVHRPGLAEGLDIRGDKVYYVPDRSFEDKRLHFMRNGIYLGELKKNRFEPSQPFALSLAGEEYDMTMDMASDDGRLQSYLRGENISVEDITERFRKEGRFLKNGWYLLRADGYSIGWGKLVGTMLKNKYPLGWRRRQ